MICYNVGIPSACNVIYPSSMKEPPINSSPEDIMKRVPKCGSWREEIGEGGGANIL